MIEPDHHTVTATASPGDERTPSASAAGDAPAIDGGGSATHDTSHTGTPLEAAFGRLIRRMRAASDARRAYDGVAIESLSAPAFRALVAERLRSLERDVAEIRSRINGLLFVVAGAVLSQLALRLLG